MEAVNGGAPSLDETVFAPLRADVLRVGEDEVRVQFVSAAHVYTPRMPAEDARQLAEAMIEAASGVRVVAAVAELPG